MILPNVAEMLKLMVEAVAFLVLVEQQEL